MFKIAVCGLGQMGIAVAYYLATHVDVDTLVLLDRSNELLQLTVDKIRPFILSKNIKVIQCDIDTLNTLPLDTGEIDVIAASLPWETTKNLIKLAGRYNVPMISMTRPKYQELSILEEQNLNHAPVVLACGLEPGLTEILSLHVLESYKQIDELRIYCGGLPQQNKSPFNYKRVFGERLPFDHKQSYYINSGKLCTAPRFSEIESIVIPEIGELEAWHDGMLPWLIEYPKLRNIKYCTQKTLRWPGFANTVNLLSTLGFLDESAIYFQGAAIAPRAFTEAVLAPSTYFDSSTDRDMTVLYLQAIGMDCHDKKLETSLCLIDKYDESNQLTSMAKMTGYTLGFAAMQLAKNPHNYYGFVRPDRLIYAEIAKELLDIFQKKGIDVKIKQKVI